MLRMLIHIFKVQKNLDQNLDQNLETVESVVWKTGQKKQPSPEKSTRKFCCLHAELLEVLQNRVRMKRFNPRTWRVSD